MKTSFKRGRNDDLLDVLNLPITTINRDDRRLFSIGQADLRGRVLDFGGEWDFRCEQGGKGERRHIPMLPKGMVKVLRGKPSVSRLVDGGER